MCILTELLPETSNLFWFMHVFHFFFRINKMVDVVTNRMFDTFNRLSPGDNQQDSLSTITRLKRFSTDQRYKRIINRQAEIKVKYKRTTCRRMCEFLMKYLPYTQCLQLNLMSACFYLQNSRLIVPIISL